MPKINGNIWNALIAVRDKGKTIPIQEKAVKLLRAYGTAGGPDLIKEEVLTFLKEQGYHHE